MFSCSACKRREKTDYAFNLGNLGLLGWAYDFSNWLVLCDKCIKERKLRIDDQTGELYK